MNIIYVVTLIVYDYVHINYVTERAKMNQVGAQISVQFKKSLHIAN